MDKYKTLTVLLFLACGAAGLLTADRAALQNDEIYSQQHGVQQLSYIDILRGRIPEGNNAPLFYVSQKLFLGLARFRLNDPWPGDELDICNSTGQRLMRILPVACMSAAVSMMFFFFARRHGLGFGALAAGILLTSPMVWAFFAQARPYALWVMLTTAQFLLFLRHLGQPGQPPPPRLLSVIHMLLCLTTPFGIVQTCAVAAVLRRNWVGLAAIPSAMAIFYTLNAPHYPFRVPQPPLELFFSNMPVECIAVIVAGAAYLIARSQLDYRILLTTIAVCAVPLALIGYYVRLNIQGTAGFGLSPRYFIFLVPVGAITLMAVITRIWEIKPVSFWMRVFLCEAAAGVLVLGAIRTHIALQGILL